MPTFLSMRTISRDLKTKIDKLMEDQIFWKALASTHLSQEQFKSILHDKNPNYKNIVLPYLEPMNTLKNNFENSLFYKPSNLNFLSRNKYFNHKTHIEFDLAEIKPFLMIDNAKRLFTKVTRLSEIYPVIQIDSFDPTHVEKIIAHFQNPEDIFIMSDLAFMDLIPSIIHFRAIKCFDLFMLAYLAILIILPGAKKFDISGTNKTMSLDYISDTIFNTNDNYFIQRFIYLMMEFYSQESIKTFKQIKRAVDAEKGYLINPIIEQLTDNKKETLLTTWRKLEKYRDLIEKLVIPSEEPRKQLTDALEKALAIIKTNQKLDIKELIELQENTQSCFRHFILTLANKNKDKIVSDTINCYKPR